MVYSAIYINSYLNKYPLSSTYSKSNATKSNATNCNKPDIENMLMIDYSFYS
jgi:hypothetical protein